MGPKIPDRWIPYSACGAIIEGTRIICFKVPLHKSVQTDPEIKKIWDVPAVLAEIPKLGAVIDLTNTAKYYNPRDFETAGVLHRKILMPGREIPPETKVREFMDAVDEFQGKGCDSLIGVHCTHGLNRTGYMVCRYMRDRLNMPGEEAIRRFEVARGYKMEREIYLASLLNKKIPRPDFDFGKETVIKPIDKENGFKSTKSDSRYENVRKNQRYGSRYGNDRYGSSKTSRYENGHTSYERSSSKYYRDRSSVDRERNSYLSWRKRDEGSSHTESSRRRYSTDDSSDQSSPERSGYSYKHDY